MILISINVYGETMENIFEWGLEKNPANYAQLTPLDFIRRSAEVYPNHTAILHGDIKRDWATTYERSKKLASALKKRGIGKGDTVSVMLPNVPAFVEAHFGVPMTGAVTKLSQYKTGLREHRFYSPTC